jgi:hypothetical protein
MMRHSHSERNLPFRALVNGSMDHCDFAEEVLVDLGQFCSPEGRSSRQRKVTGRVAKSPIDKDSRDSNGGLGVQENETILLSRGSGSMRPRSIR